jgi:hypothetical protein
MKQKLNSLFSILPFIIAAAIPLSCNSPSGNTATPAQSLWIQSGPLGRVNSIAIISTTVFAGTAAGVYRSSDNGANWTQVNQGLANTDVNALATIGTNLYAGTTSNGTGGAFLSTDNGASWSAISHNTFDLFDGVSAFGVSGNELFAATTRGVFRWTNNGTAWTKSNTGLEGIGVDAFAVHGANIFAGSFEGLFRSNDNGLSWTPINSGLSTPIVLSLIVSGPNVFVGIGDTVAHGAGVFLSTNDGTNWTLANAGLPFSYNGQTYSNEVWAFGVDGNDLYAGSQDGVYLSTNNGTSWTSDTTTLKDLVLSFGLSGSSIFAGTFSSGVWRHPL